MMQELRMKKQNTILDCFRKFLTNCILIYKGVVVVVLLHKLVPSDEASKYFDAMANMWEFGKHVTRTYSPNTKMVMFGHRFCYNDYVPARSAYQP